MKRLAFLTLLAVLDRLFPSTPPAHIAAEQQRAQEMERQKALTWAARIRAQERAPYTLLDVEERERELAWDGAE